MEKFRRMVRTSSDTADLGCYINYKRYEKQN